MGMYPEILLFIPAIVIVWILILVARLRQYRIDIGPAESFTDGRSRYWQVNLFSPQNYNEKGRKLLRWLVFAQLLWLACLVGFTVMVS